MMIETVIFDIGNVLIDFDWKTYIRQVLSDPKVIEKVESAIWDHGLWDELDRGVMSDEEIIAGFIGYAPDCEREIRLAFRTIGGCVRRRDSAIPWIQSVKDAGRRVLFLSNYSRLIMQANPDVLDFLPLMDGGIFSCDVHLLKPDRAIYACLCEKYNLNPAACVFIDDNGPNIMAAGEFGLNTIRFEHYEQAHAELEAMLKAGVKTKGEARNG